MDTPTIVVNKSVDTSHECPSNSGGIQWEVGLDKSQETDLYSSLSRKIKPRKSTSNNI